ncbi:hypothetical protein EVAR_44986_1 [Eumeta japonica]|uniref:Gustatory receptor n=1 Tax=Eumeta variegata TaxID=151549 RepID=A0A4C1XFQ6_EUMVA|nr:hypothetical protein EVAR_44986_1 [Eumeta japonica]
MEVVDAIVNSVVSATRMEELNIVLKNKVDNDFIGLFKPCQQIQMLFSVNKYELRRHRVDSYSYRYLLSSVIFNVVAITNFYFFLLSFNFDTARFIDYISAGQVVIGFVDEKVRAFSFIWGIIFLTSKDLLLLILISAAYEKVYTKIEELQRTCAMLYENRIDVALRRAAKNMIRLCSVRHAKMRVFGLFTVDAALRCGWRDSSLPTALCCYNLHFCRFMI